MRQHGWLETEESHGQYGGARAEELARETKDQ